MVVKTCNYHHCQYYVYKGCERCIATRGNYRCMRLYPSEDDLLSYDAIRCYLRMSGLADGDDAVDQVFDSLETFTTNQLHLLLKAISLVIKDDTSAFRRKIRLLYVSVMARKHDEYDYENRAQQADERRQAKLLLWKCKAAERHKLI